MTQSQHIIIVDDEAPAREMVGDYLKMHGFTVTLCDGGKSLRGAIETNVPDLVVLDLNMPEEDGLSIVKRIIDMHGGRVTADSEGPGQGSTFTVILPATEIS